LRLTDALPFRQVVVAFQRRADRLESVSVIRGGFMRLRDRVEDPSLPWPELNVTETTDGRERTVASLSGSTLETLPDHAKRKLLAVMLTTPRPQRLGVRVSGWPQWDLEAFLALSAPEDRLVGCMREDLGSLMFMSPALPAIIDRDGNGLAYLAGKKTISRLDAHGRRAPDAVLARLVDEWRRRGRPDVRRLRIAVSYGSRRLTAWRLKIRGTCMISYDWS
jgi:predicted DNA-binding transcriptional regulator AlpA